MGIATDTDHDARASQNDARTTGDLESFESPSLHVIAAIAEATDDDPATMPPLYDAIDPDALDTVLDGDGTVEIRFEYGGHVIEATGDGTVLVDGEAHPSE